jgi:hypothetical protein
MSALVPPEAAVLAERESVFNRDSIVGLYSWMARFQFEVRDTFIPEAMAPDWYRETRLLSIEFHLIS